MSPSRQDLTTGPIGSTLLKFSLPVLGGNVLQSLNASVNAVWVGHYLGEAALTATSNANIILFFLLGVVFGVGMATTILVGQSVGRKDIAQARCVVGTGSVFFIVLSVIAAVLGYVFTPAIFVAMGTPIEAQPLAISYLRVIFIALPFMFFFSFVMMALRCAARGTHARRSVSWRCRCCWTSCSTRSSSLAWDPCRRWALPGRRWPP
jgi:Na+-driven multidrug efflux pump